MSTELIDKRGIVARIFRFLWNSLKAVQTLVFGIIAVLLIIAVVAALIGQRGPKIPYGGALVLNPRGVLVEQESAIGAEFLLQGSDVPQQALIKDIIDALALAKDDKRIGLLVLELDELEGGLLPKLERIATAIAEFKSSGKKVIAVAQNYSQPALLLAVQADRVLLNPEGIAVPEGFGMFRTYYKTLLDNADVSVNLFKVGKYKSATEPFFRDSMSDEDREARLAIMDKWWDAYTGAVESARSMDKGSLDKLLHDAPNQIRRVEGNLARLSLEKGLVDRLVSDDERRTYLIELAGEDKENNEYRGISYRDYLTAARKPEKHKSNKVAVITAVGTIEDGSADPGGIGSESLTKLIRKARKDEKVKAIVLRVDSGGGSKTASEIIRRELEAVQETGIPVVASMGSVAASGGYWISATADEIWALPTTITGSIGIFGLIPSFEKTLARYGVHSDGVATTPIAGGASVVRGISPVYAEVLQTVIEAGYEQFLTTVAKGRDMDTDAVHKIAQGRVWTGAKALQLGLVDQMGDLEQAIEAAARLADVEDYSVWYVEPERSIEELVLRELMSAVSIVRPEDATNPISQVVRSIRQDLNFLGHLNDPRSAYAICSDCPMGP